MTTMAGPLDVEDDPKSLSKHTSQATLTPNSLPDGCSYGEIPSKIPGERPEPVIWVEFPPDSPDNPYYFTAKRKVGITICALIYTWYCCESLSPTTVPPSPPRRMRGTPQLTLASDDRVRVCRPSRLHVQRNRVHRYPGRGRYRAVRVGSRCNAIVRRSNLGRVWAAASLPVRSSLVLGLSRCACCVSYLGRRES